MLHNKPDSQHNVATVQSYAWDKFVSEAYLSYKLKLFLLDQK